MKTTVMAMMVAMVVSVMCFGQDEPSEPKKLTNMRGQYEKMVKAAVDPITRDYVDALTDLKKELGGKGDAAGAMAVQKEIDEVKEKLSVDSQRANMVVGDWIWSSGTPTHILANGKVVADNGFNGTWSYVAHNNTYVIKWDRWATQEFVLSSDRAKMNGKHIAGPGLGETLTIKRKK